MSRNLKRVPLSFSWQLHKVWDGYINPYYAQCSECPDCEHGNDRAGGRPDANAALFQEQWYGNAPFDPAAYGAELLSPLDPAIWDTARRNVDRAPDYYMTRAEKLARAEQRAKIQTEEGIHVVQPTFDEQDAVTREAGRLHELWRYQWCHHLIQADVDALVAHERLWDLTSTWSQEHGWQKRADGHHPTAAEVNAWSFESFGHDAINSGACVEARCKREGVPYMCARCHGSGRIWPSPEIKRKYENWKRKQPPKGRGYQLWEDCSEGSPVSPVFASLDELCAWAADHATTFGSYKATKAEWLEMLDGGIVHAKMGDHILL